MCLPNEKYLHRLCGDYALPRFTSLLRLRLYNGRPLPVAVVLGFAVGITPYRRKSISAPITYTYKVRKLLLFVCVYSVLIKTIYAKCKCGTVGCTVVALFTTEKWRNGENIFFFASTIKNIINNFRARMF